MKYVLATIMVLVQLTQSAKDKNLYCGACKAIMDEVEYSVGKIDPNKKINVGSFRVDPDGRTRTVQKSYARSESFLSEVLENVCKDISDNYVESNNPKTGKKILQRMVTRDGKMSADVDFHKLLEDTQSQGADTPPDAKSNRVKFACESIVEDYEDEILHHFKNAHDDASSKICSEIAEYCEEQEHRDEL